jgi:hypothetical protein
VFFSFINIAIIFFLHNKVFTTKIAFKTCSQQPTTVLRIGNIFEMSGGRVDGTRFFVINIKNIKLNLTPF